MTGPTGRFEFKDLIPGRYELATSREELVEGFAWRHVETADTGSEAIELTLADAPNLVVHVEGWPAGSRIVAELASRGVPRPRWWARQWSEGASRLVFHDVPPGEELQLLVRSPHDHPEYVVHAKGLRAGQTLTAIGRSAERHRIRHEHYRSIAAATTRPGTGQKEAEDTHAAVTLTGATIFKRWTASYKEMIYNSRILTTRHVVAALPEGRSVTLCSASGAGYYGNRGEDILKEDERVGHDFLAGVSKDWEKEAQNAAAKGVRVAVMRFGVVLGKSGGALAKMIPAFKMFVGGSMGSGNQWFPWIHLDLSLIHI